MAVLALAAIGACSDSTATAPTRPQQARGTPLELSIPLRGPSVNDPSSGPRFATLATPDADADQPQVHVTAKITMTSTLATLQGIVEWMGTQASAVAHLIVYDSDGKMYGAPVDGYASATYLFPTKGTLYPTAQLALGKRCGLIGSGSVTADVITGAIGTIYGEAKGASSAAGYQSVCTTTSSTSGGTTTTTTTGSNTDGGMWVQDCKWVESGYVDSTGSHTTASYVCQMIYIA